MLRSRPPFAMDLIHCLKHYYGRVGQYRPTPNFSIHRFIMSHTARSPALLCFVLCLLLGLPLSSDALGLGDIQVRSSIGQKLDAEIEFSSLTAAEADSLTIRLASPELFAQTGIDYISALRSLRFTVEKKGDRPVIRLTSEMPISEPFLNVLIELNAAGSRTLRQYALLLDPPSLIEPPVVPQAADTVTSPVVPAKTTPESAANASAATRSDKKEKAVNPGVGTTADTPPVKADTHTVRRGETLAAIATARRNEGVSVEQMMIALYRTNPQAFIGSNINRLKSGVVLSIPDPEVVRGVGAVRARALIREQHVGFQRYREQLARYNTQPRDVDAAATLSPGRTEASSRSGVRSSSGSITAPVQEASGPPPVAQDKLKLGMPARDAAPTAGQQDALNQIATDKALAEANARIAALEKNISDLRQLAELRSKAPSDEPAGSVGSAPPEPPPSPARMPPSSGVTPALPATAVPSPALDNSWRPGDLPDWVRQSPLIPAGGVAVMSLLIAGLLRYRRRRQTVPEGALMVEDVQSVLEQAGGGRHIDTSNSVFHSNFVPSVSQLDTNEVDAVAEADVYIAYGRDEQAEEILQEALRLHPERHTLRVKLLEIYASRKDRQKFGNLAAELRVMTHGAGDAWSQAAQMGRMLDPGNLLYGAVPQDQSAPRSMTGAVQPTPAQKTVEAGTASTPVSPVEDFELSLEGLLGDPQSHIHPTGKATARQPASQNDRSADMPAAVPVGGDANTLAFERPDSMLFSLQGASPVRPTVNPVGFPGAPADVAAMQTKLDLAIACEEIGDNEGARELLTEVAGGPDTTLARRAQSLLSQLA